MRSILIIPYFGRLPNYFDLWLHTASLQKKFDFLIVTNNSPRPTSFDNIKWIEMSFSSFKIRLNELGINSSNIKQPYKICDLRPAFAIIFNKEVANYEYWGYCDLDMIFGDLHPIYEKLVNLNPDKIGLKGHFTLFKNDKRLNELWRRKNPDGLSMFEALETSFPCHFDEVGINEIFIHFQCYIINLTCFFDVGYHANCFYDMSPSVFHKNSRIYFEYIDKKIFTFDQEGAGSPNQVCYVHFQKRNMKTLNNNFKHFYILPNAFTTCISDLNSFLRGDIEFIGKRHLYIIIRLRQIFFKLSNGGIKHRLKSILKRLTH
jgi:hypothetical protein